MAFIINGQVITEKGDYLSKGERSRLNSTMRTDLHKDFSALMKYHIREHMSVGFDEPDKTDRILAKLLNKTYPIASQKLLNRHKKYNEGIEIALKYQSQNKALIIAPADCCGVNTLTKKSENLLQLYNKGYKDSESLLSFIKSDSQAIV